MDTHQTGERTFSLPHSSKQANREIFPVEKDGLFPQLFSDSEQPPAWRWNLKVTQHHDRRKTTFQYRSGLTYVFPLEKQAEGLRLPIFETVRTVCSSLEFCKESQGQCVAVLYQATGLYIS